MKKIIVPAAIMFSMTLVQLPAAEGGMLNNNGYMNCEYTYLQESSAPEQSDGKAGNDSSGGYYCEGDRCYYRGNK